MLIVFVQRDGPFCNLMVSKYNLAVRGRVDETPKFSFLWLGIVVNIFHTCSYRVWTADCGCGIHRRTAYVISNIMQNENGKLTYVTIVVVLSLLYHSFVEHSSFISRDKCIVGYRNIVAVVQFGRSVRHVSFVFGRSQCGHWMLLLLLVFEPFCSAIAVIAFGSVIRIRWASIRICSCVLGRCVRCIRWTGIVIIEIMAAVTEWCMIRSI